MNKKVKLGIALGAVGAAIGANMIKAAKFVPEKKDDTPYEEERVNIERYTQNLSDAIKIKTISHLDESLTDWSKFDELQQLIRERYPLIHQNLTIEKVSRASLIYTWQGTNPDLEPIALLGHQDVVPISEGTECDWEHDPFGGEIADGYLWGRGAIDMKNHLIGILEAVETLIEDGFVPERTVLLCLGHNEEVVAAKVSGAKEMAKYLQDKGITLDSVLDEGGAILPIHVPGVIDRHLAGVGVAEKGYCDYEISISAKGGHSSTPPAHTALGELADIIKDVENNQFKSEINPILAGLLDTAGRNMSFGMRNIMCHLPVLKPVLKAVMTQIPAAATFVRTTSAVTMAQGSPAANILPQRASITANFRVMPGKTIADVGEHLRKVIKNKNAEITLIGGNEPSIISPTDSRAYKAIEEISYRMDNKNMVTPYLVMGGTDARNYQNICSNIYRFSPFVLNPSLLFTTHGTNERISVDSFKDAISFFKRYIKTLAG